MFSFQVFGLQISYCMSEYPVAPPRPQRLTPGHAAEATCSRPRSGLQVADASMQTAPLAAGEKTNPLAGASTLSLLLLLERVRPHPATRY